MGNGDRVVWSLAVCSYDKGFIVKNRMQFILLINVISFSSSIYKGVKQIICCYDFISISLCSFEFEILMHTMQSEGYISNLAYCKCSV